MKFTQTWGGRARAVALAGLGVALVTVGVAAGQPGQPARGQRMRGPMPFAQLNLTDDQQARVKAVFDEQRGSGETAREALSTAQDELRKAIFGSATPDMAQIDALTTRIAGLQADALRAHTTAQLKIAAILTDEQRQQMATARPPRGRGPGRGPGGPGR
jgi:Spy/CpxP family protein refolding chaperone